MKPRRNARFISPEGRASYLRMRRLIARSDRIHRDALADVPPESRKAAARIYFFEVRPYLVRALADISARTVTMTPILRLPEEDRR